MNYTIVSIEEDWTSNEVVIVLADINGREKTMKTDIESINELARQFGHDETTADEALPNWLIGKSNDMQFVPMLYSGQILN